MCGFVGFSSFKNHFESNENMHMLKNMNACLSRRGPDEEGFYTNNHIGFAHKRLIVIDPEGR